MVATVEPTPGQLAVWHALQVGGGPEFHICRSVRIAGPVDVAGLVDAIHRFTSTLAALHVRYATEGRRLEIHEVAPGPVEATIEDLSDQGLMAAEARRVRFCGRSFSLDTEPGLRFLVQRCSSDVWLTAVGHHLALDGASVDAIVSGVLSTYCGQPVTPPSKRLTGTAPPTETASRQYELSLAGVEQNRPFDGPEPDAGSVTVVQRTVDANLARALRSTARAAAFSLSHCLFTLYATVAHAWSDSDDLVLITPVDIRSRADRAAWGMGVSSIAVRSTIAGDQTLREMGSVLREEFLMAYRHRSVGVVGLARRVGLGRRADGSSWLTDYEFNVMTAWVPPAAAAAAGLTITPAAQCVVAPQYDVSLSAIADDDHLELCWQVRGRDSAKAELLHDLFCRFAQAWVDDPEAQLRDVPLLEPGEAAALRAFGSGPDRAVDQRSVVDRVLAHVTGRADDIAVETSSCTYTYRHLADRVDGIGAMLKAVGVVPGDRIAVHLERSFDLVAAMLATWAVGCVYVPIDRNNPPPRVTTMLDLVAARVLLVDGPADGFAGMGTPPVMLELSSGTIMGESGPIHQPSSPRDPAYIVFTSGSTGRPKAAEIHVAGMINHLDEMIRIGDLSATDVFGQLAPLSFDVHIWQILAPLVLGGRLRLISQEELRDPLELARVCAAAGVTVLQAVPSYLEMWHHLAATNAERTDPAIRVLYVTGEAFPTSLAKRLVRMFPGATLVNAYGPAEASDDVALHVGTVDDASVVVPIGLPVANAELLVVDRWGRMRPRGLNGELLVGGLAVGNGYLEPDARGAFHADHDSSSGRTYLTGDVCRIEHDRFVFQGRRDQQVKVGGRRIELGEIESACASVDGVTSAAVIASGRGAGTRLVAFVTGHRSLTAAVLREGLFAQLPAFMVPRVVIVDSLPLTANAKIDRDALLALDHSTTSIPAATHELVRATWADVLRTGAVAGTDNFFGLGGDSLRAIEVITRLRRHGVQAEISALYTAQSLDAFIDLLVDHPQPAPDRSVPLPAVVQWHLGSDGPTFLQGVTFEAAVSEQEMTDAITRVLDAHPVLRGRIGLHDGRWLLDPTAGDDIWLHATGTAPEELTQRAIEQLCEDRLVAWASTALPGRTRVALVAHHAVVDSSSWTALLGDLDHVLDGGSPASPEWGYLTHCATGDEPVTIPPSREADATSAIHRLEIPSRPGTDTATVEAAVVAVVARGWSAHARRTTARVVVERDLRFGPRTGPRPAPTGVGCYVGLAATDLDVSGDDRELVRSCALALGAAADTSGWGSADIMVNTARAGISALALAHVQEVHDLLEVPQLNARSMPTPVVVDMTTTAHTTHVTLTVRQQGDRAWDVDAAALRAAILDLLDGARSEVPAGLDLLDMDAKELAGLLTQLDLEQR
ncbi:amino acid adenylation domain-containing protein [Dactylosporangium sp. NPDC050588]|uniref:non-ribosomal peptide synthetase n=1 Tax=Dactylosporangium sp. NPDC050588 TaxID=3157211 RepID=UPI0033C2C3CD